MVVKLIQQISNEKFTAVINILSDSLKQKMLK